MHLCDFLLCFLSLIFFLWTLLQVAAQPEMAALLSGFIYSSEGEGPGNTQRILLRGYLLLIITHANQFTLNELSPHIVSGIAVMQNRTESV